MDNQNPITPLSPPEWMLRFFRWFCNPEFVEDIEGDLNERFAQRTEAWGIRKAKRSFAWEILMLFRPGIIRPIKLFSKIIHPIMFKQNLKIGFRYLIKNKVYSSIKIGGFAIGIAAFLLISLFVVDELKVDQHYEQQDRLFRLVNVTSNPEFKIKKWTSFSAPIKEVLKKDFPEVEEAGRLIVRDWYLAGENQFRRSDEVQNTFEEGFAYVDASLLDILEIPLLYGTREEALAQPNSLVLSKKKADQYFPGEDPVGKTVILNDNPDQTFTIGGVMRMLPSTHFNSEFLISMEGVEFWRGEQGDWCCNNYDAYMRLKPGTNVQQLEEKLISIRDNYLVRYNEETENPFAEVLKKHRSFELQPVGAIHLKSNDIYDEFLNGDIRIVRLFGAIAIFILLLACVNFINLFTAKSANRAKEIGVRKVNGSMRRELIQQFLTESTLYSGISVVLGAGISVLTLPYFNQLTGKELAIPFMTWWLLPALFLLALLIGLVAGTYPSFYLSSFKPIDVLKGKLSSGSKNSGLRNSMVVFQFTTSIILLVCAFIVNHQMQFILNTEVGFDKDNMLMIQGAGTLGDKTEVFKEQINRLATVESVTNSSYFPIEGTNRDAYEFWIDGKEKIEEGVSAQAWWVAENYIPSMKISISEGRNFSEEFAGDTAAVIINQTMAKKLGLQDPIGKQIRNWRAWNIVGVVEDFHFENMKQDIRPLVFFRGRGSAAIIAARLQTSDPQKTIREVTKIWDQFMPNQSIRYTFMQEAYANMYKDVKRTRGVFTTCAILAILIACLGLFGLSTFMVAQRSKEISIRKILGASVPNLFGLLTSNYLKLLLISSIIGIPVAWYLMDSWLASYSYSISIAWWVFLLAGAIVAAIALLTVSRQALKLTFSNPTRFLKDN